MWFKNAGPVSPRQVGVETQWSYLYGGLHVSHQVDSQKETIQRCNGCCKRNKYVKQVDSD